MSQKNNTGLKYSISQGIENALSPGKSPGKDRRGSDPQRSRAKERRGRGRRRRSNKRDTETFLSVGWDGEATPVPVPPTGEFST